jgi:hypothetical protein
MLASFWIVEVSAIVVVGCYLLVFVHLWIVKVLAMVVFGLLKFQPW